MPSVQTKASEPALLAMRGIRKRFGGTPVLHGVDLDLRAGEVLALLGENGAGKSTLIKILNGDYTRDAGEIYLLGQQLALKSPRDARRAGIAVIYQELNFAPDLTVAENVMLGHLPRMRRIPGMVDWRAARERSTQILSTLNCVIPPTTLMSQLGVGERQLVEIAKSLSMQARVLVMDEPTAALTPREVRVLLSTVQALRQRGVGIIYISHRLDEVEQAAQRVMVLRDGRVAGVIDAAGVDRRTIVRMMVGRELTAAAHKPRSRSAQPALAIDSLSRERAFEDVSFSVGRGEIVGMFGLLGAGHLQVARAIFGAEPATGGTILQDQRPLRPRSPRQAMSRGIGLVPEDRKAEGIVAGMSLFDNLTLGNWRHVSRVGVVSRPAQVRRAADWIGRLGIRSGRGPTADVETLSGGNQQKVVLARWLEAGVRILLLNEPTRGVDVGARADIYRLIDELRSEGLGVLMASSDLEEVLEVSDRILVFSKGRIAAEFDRATATPDRLLSAAAGGKA